MTSDQQALDEHMTQLTPASHRSTLMKRQNSPLTEKVGVLHIKACSRSPIIECRIRINCGRLYFWDIQTLTVPETQLA